MTATLERPFYNRASAVLDAAHKACFNHPDRGVIGMSHGPFSGVNEALGIVSELETALSAERARSARLMKKINSLVSQKQ